MNHCKQCNIGFEITNSHQEFYNRIDVPAPTLCPDCRQQRRLSFRNERNLYRISCDCCKRTIISIYSPDKKLTVYCNDCWWSDKWDPHSYGKDFDFSRTFFEQFNDLKANIPNFALLNINSENSEYTHLETDDKNCYMNFGGHYNEDCYYNLHALKCQDCVDNYWVDQCRGCYECFKCFSSHNLKFCFWCHNSHDLTFCYDCKGCSDCFGCTSLRQKQYYFFNKPMTKEGYNKKMNAWVSNTANIDLAKYESEILWKSTPRLNLFIEKSQNSTGNFLKNCKNCTNCYETDEAEDCTYCDLVLGLKDCMDCTRMGYRTELCYEVMGATISNNVAFLNFSFNVISDSRYIDCCSSIHNCFGCTNLHHKKYCILNKQYTKGEYDKLVLKIIEHMKKTGEYGEFFPSSISPFGYNETVAMDYYPKTKKEALLSGYKWSDYEMELSDYDKIIPADRLPDDINDVPDDILNWAIECKQDQKLFKIVPQELAFYRKNNLPIPHLCSSCRQNNRIQIRNFHTLYDRKCDKCQSAISTIYPPDGEEMVYCEDCYLKEVY